MALTRLPWQKGEPEPVPRHIPGTPIHHVTSLIPITRRNDLDTALTALEDRTISDGVSPFAAMPQVHMLRIQTLDTIPAGGRRPRRVVLDISILLFGVSFEGNTGHLARSLIDTVPDLCDTIFGCCAGYPGKDRVQLAAWFRQFEVKPNLPYSAGFSSRREIENALDRTNRLRRFMPRASSHSAAELKAAFLEEFS